MAAKIAKEGQQGIHAKASNATERKSLVNGSSSKIRTNLLFPLNPVRLPSRPKIALAHRHRQIVPLLVLNLYLATASNLDKAIFFYIPLPSPSPFLQAGSDTGYRLNVFLRERGAMTQEQDCWKGSVSWALCVHCVLPCAFL